MNILPVSKRTDLSEDAKIRRAHSIWEPIVALVTVLIIFFVAQYGAAIILLVGSKLFGIDENTTRSWLNSTAGQFTFLAMAEPAMIILAILFLRHRKISLRSIGIRMIRFKDPIYAIVGFGIYFGLYIAAVLTIKKLFPSFDIEQEQDIGFKAVVGNAHLIMAFVSLVVLPPIAEEFMFRGFLFSGLRRKFSVIISAVIVSLVFAGAHLSEGVGGLLWIGAVDTFVLSMVLCGLRVKTGSIWAGVLVHAAKNGLAFYVLFIHLT